MNAAMASTQTTRRQAKGPAGADTPPPMADIILALEQVQDMFAEISICGFPTDQDEVGRRGHLAMIAEINFGEGWAVPGPAEEEANHADPGPWPDVPSVADTLHIPLKYHNRLAKGDPGACRIHLEREQLATTLTAYLDLAKSVDEYRWLVKMTAAQKEEALLLALAAAVAAWQADPTGASKRLARFHGHGTSAERQQQLQELLDGTLSEEPPAAMSGGLFGRSIRHRAPQKPISLFDLDFAPLVSDVRYPLLVDFLVYAHQERLSLLMISGGPATEQVLEPMRDRLEPKYKALTDKEQNLLVEAGNALYVTDKCDWTGWLIWTDSQRVAAAADLLDKVTRGWLYVGLCAKHGAAIEPHLVHVLDVLASTRFCQPEDQEPRP